MTKEKRSGLNSTALLFRLAVTNDADPAHADRKSKRLDKSVSKIDAIEVSCSAMRNGAGYHPCFFRVRQDFA